MSKYLYFIILISTTMISQNRNLEWTEEFNGKKINTDIWNFKKGLGHNNEEQYYTSRAKNIRIEEGMLIIEARKEKFKGSKYTSARINTIGNKLFKYGRIEIRAKLSEGKGTWPAIWMLGENRQRDGYPASGEIDIMEHVGKSPTEIHGAIHYPELDNKKLNSSVSSFEIPSSKDGFHRYAIEWDQKSINYFIDEQLFHCFTIEDAEREGRENIFKKPFYLIINLALGGNWAGEIDDSIFPARFYVDYVRYYQ
ncbi:family 16 glycosylhydrolase [Gillisia hiemivivida]|uniref:Glycoside hydrolase family 16 protein n=1 Tax=Gillisia hiemivivida TaxID=291190 RepID=A0A5C6ZPQ5_9FLAO|nr:glycoside hydrolase family 16 protein [Gillisia hiemivivida]TXD92741.1 glycoside hydrolase family 16 protein [Gillisia hiemivivida]